MTAATRESITGCVVEAMPATSPPPLQQDQNINLHIEQNHVVIAVLRPFAVATALADDECGSRFGKAVCESSEVYI